MEIEALAPRDRYDRHLPKHEFVAGRVSLDFCNTTPRSDLDEDWDRARHGDDLVAWTERGGFALHAAPGTAELARLLALRDTLVELFDAAVDGRAPPAKVLDVFNAELADARSAERLVKSPNGYVFVDATAGIDRLRREIVRDAESLLIGDLRRIKRCPDHECRWFFHDGSKNLSRRWCSMDDCGTRDKVRRFRGREAH